MCQLQTLLMMCETCPFESRLGRGAFRRPSRSRSSRTIEWRVSDCEGWLTVGEYEDGTPAELTIRVSKQGSTLVGILDALSRTVTVSLQGGVPFIAIIREWTNMRFEPAGMTDDPELRFASSILDYVRRRVAVEYLTPLERQEIRHTNC